MENKEFLQKDIALDRELSSKELKQPINGVGKALIINTLLQGAVVAVLALVVSIGTRFDGVLQNTNAQNGTDILLTQEFLLISAAIAAVIGVLPFIGLAKRSKIELKSIFSKVKPEPEYVKVGIIAVGMGCLVGYLSVLLQLLLNQLGYRIDMPNILEPSNSVTIIISQFLFACLIGPIVEEFIFRGVILKLLARYSNKFAIILSALIFGIIHGNFYQMFGAFATGLFLAYLTLKTGSILPAILVHIFNNTISMTQNYITMLPSEYAGVIIYGIDIVTIAFALYFMFKLKLNLFALSGTPTQYSVSKKSKLVFTSPPLLLFLIAFFLFAVILIKPIV